MTHSTGFRKAMAFIWMLQAAQPAMAEHAAGTRSASGAGREVSGAKAKLATDAIETMAGKLFASMPAACQGKNLGVSPYNLASALVPILMGSDKKTKAEFSVLFGLAGPEKIPDFLGSYAELNKQLIASAGPKGFTNEVLVMAEQKEKYRKEFVEAVQRITGASPRKAPFDAQLAGKIDEWVRAQTAGRIPSIAPNPMPRDGILVFSASAFQMPWAHQFPAEDTKERSFKTASGSSVNVPMMKARKIDKGRYFQPRAADIAELTYVDAAADGAHWRAQIVIGSPEIQEEQGEKPTYPTNFSIVSQLGTDSGVEKVKHSAKENFTGEGPTVVLPRIEINSDSGECVKAALKVLVPSAFSGGISEAVNAVLGISHVGHKQFIKVNEEGTEAAAATAIAISKGGLSPGEIHFDRPYVFIVRGPSGVPVFVQVVEDPSKKN